MSVYVDSQKNRFGRTRMSHMLADTEDELHGMARRIGLKKTWFQRGPGRVPHYDISQSKRSLAIEHGAITIDRIDLVALIGRLRKNQP